ncbi:MAG: TonB family protein, partial [Myxococcota bacterium]
MKDLAVALIVGVVLTALTVVLVASLRGIRESAPEKPTVRSESVVIAERPPEQSKPEWELARAPSPPDTAAQALEPLLLTEATELNALADLHPGAALVRVLPRPDSGGFLRNAREGSATQSVDEPARPIRRPAPTYPAEARRKRIEGFVRVRLRVDGEGRVSDVLVVEAEPPGVFDAVAVTAARQ